MTENWKPSGTGGRSSRGWGGVVESRAIAEGLAKTFEADAGFRDAVPWRQFRNRTSVVAAPPVPRAEFPTRFESASLTADRVAVLAAPDNAAERIVEELDAATTRIRVEQISIGSRHHPFVRALLAAAERGVSVKVLLGSAFYVREENRELADWLNERARREGLPLEAKLAAPRSRFEKIHAKGIVIDQRVVLGSINWTNESIRRNREVALLIDDPAAARYFTRVFRADWRGGRWSVPAGLLAVALAVSAVAAYGTRSLRFGTDHSVSPDAAIDP